MSFMLQSWFSIMTHSSSQKSLFYWYFIFIGLWVFSGKQEMLISGITHCLWLVDRHLLIPLVSDGLNICCHFSPSCTVLPSAMGGEGGSCWVLAPATCTSPCKWLLQTQVWLTHTVPHVFSSLGAPLPTAPCMYRETASQGPNPSATLDCCRHITVYTITECFLLIQDNKYLCWKNNGNMLYERTYQACTSLSKKGFLDHKRDV